MQRCISLAKKGWEFSRPNPCVGCVIVYKDTIIGEGFTQGYGGAHAEVVAIRSVTNKKLLSESTLYVTLEPCAHFGKTPPCVDLIIQSKIKKVVIGCKDSHKKVNGKGIEKLQSNGVEVVVGFLEAACREAHKCFITFSEKKRPYIFLKWAESRNGYIAPKMQNKQQPHWISSVAARQLAHQYRAENQGILVGTRTILKDNPTLNVRHTAGKNPVRIVLDSTLRLQRSLNVFNQDSKTFIITDKKNKNSHRLFAETHTDYFFIDFLKPVAKQIANLLYKKNIQSILVEGGRQTLQTFLQEKIWDEALVFKSFEPMKQGGTQSPALPENAKLIKRRVIQNEYLEYFKP